MWGKETMKVVGLTETECSMMHVLTKRLGSISSPVVRSQLLLQMSQLIDIAFIGDTSSKYEQELVAQVDELSLRLCECEETGAEEECVAVPERRPDGRAAGAAPPGGLWRPLTLSHWHSSSFLASGVARRVPTRWTGPLPQQTEVGG